jgi:hypothetical protein
MDMMISLPAQGKRTMVITLAPMAEWRLYKMAHLQTAKSGFPKVSALAAFGTNIRYFMRLGARSTHH